MRLLFTGAASPRLASALLALALAACSNDVTAPQTPTTTALTVDASTTTAFVRLGAQPRVVTGTDTTTAAGWDISANATTINLNAADVTGYCLCAHETSTDAGVMAMTADAELAGFESITANDLPATAAFQADVFATRKWYRYNLTGNDHQIWPTFDVYFVKRGSALYKVQIAGYYNATGAPRFITIRSALLRS
jgi:hypothetical protein